MEFNRISILLSGAEVSEIQSGASTFGGSLDIPAGCLLVSKANDKYNYADSNGWFLKTPTFTRQLINIEARWPGASRCISHQLDTTPFGISYTEIAWECFAHWRAGLYSPNRGEKTRSRGPAAPDVDLSDLKL